MKVLSMFISKKSRSSLRIHCLHSFLVKGELVAVFIMSERTTVLAVVEKYKRAALVAFRSKREFSHVIKRSFM